MGGQLNTSYIDPETGVETARNPQAQAMEYTDPMGRRQTGYSIGNRMYKDEAGTQRIENGSLVTNASGTQTWVMTDQGGVKLQEYMNGQEGKESASPSGVDYLSGAQESALNAASKRTEAGITELEAQRPEIERAYREVNRQNYQGYMQSREGLANSLASQGLYNSGYSDSAQIAQTTAYRERANATALERVRALRELETQISVARMEGSANLSELEAQYQQLMQEQWNVDRAYNYQVGRDAIGDARYDKEWEHQLEREAVGDAQWEKEFAAAQAAVEFEKELALKEAKSAEEQQAIENAFKLGMAGDVSRLKELGMDTSYLERLLALEEQQLYQSVYGGGGSGGGYSSGGGDAGSALNGALRQDIEEEAAGLATIYANETGYDRGAKMLSYLQQDGTKRMYENKYGTKGYQYLLEVCGNMFASARTPVAPTHAYTAADLYDTLYSRIYVEDAATGHKAKTTDQDVITKALNDMNNMDISNEDLELLLFKLDMEEEWNDWKEGKGEGEE